MEENKILATLKFAVIVILVISSLINISLNNDTHALWQSLLFGVLGYLLPALNIRMLNIQPTLPV